MPTYEWQVEFDAEDDADAKRIIEDEKHGAIQAFDSIRRDELMDADTARRVQ